MATVLLSSRRRLVAALAATLCFTCWTLTQPVTLGFLLKRDLPYGRQQIVDYLWWRNCAESTNVIFQALDDAREDTQRCEALTLMLPKDFYRDETRLAQYYHSASSSGSAARTLFNNLNRQSWGEQEIRIAAEVHELVEHGPLESVRPFLVKVALLYHFRMNKRGFPKFLLRYFEHDRENGRKIFDHYLWSLHEICDSKTEPRTGRLDPEATAELLKDKELVAAYRLPGFRKLLDYEAKNSHFLIEHVQVSLTIVLWPSLCSDLTNKVQFSSFDWKAGEVECAKFTNIVYCVGDIQLLSKFTRFKKAFAQFKVLRECLLKLEGKLVDWYIKLGSASVESSSSLAFLRLNKHSARLVRDYWQTLNDKRWLDEVSLWICNAGDMSVEHVTPSEWELIESHIVPRLKVIASAPHDEASITQAVDILLQFGHRKLSQDAIYELRQLQADSD